MCRWAADGCFPCAVSTGCRGFPDSVSGSLVAVYATESEIANVDLNKWYVLVNRNSGVSMDDYNFATNDGVPVVYWSRGDTQNQQWRFLGSGNGYYRLLNRMSGKVLDDYSASTSTASAPRSP